VTDSKLAVATDHGAETAVNGRTGTLRDAIRDWTDGRGADGVLELVGPETMRETLPSLAKGGRMVVVGSQTGREITIDPTTLFQNEWELLGSRNCTKLELREVVDLVASRRLQPVIADSYPLEQAEHAHDRQRAHAVIGRDVLEP